MEAHYNYQFHDEFEQPLPEDEPLQEETVTSAIDAIVEAEDLPKEEPPVEKEDLDEVLSPRKYISQPAFQVKDSEPATQFYYQPPTVQKDYVFHVPKEDPVFIPVQQQEYPVYRDYDSYLKQNDLLYASDKKESTADAKKEEEIFVSRIKDEEVEPELYPISKPPTPPPLPPLPTPSNPASTFTSRGNTLKRTKPIVHKKTPWSMEEVLQQHSKMRPRVERRYHPSYADDPDSSNVRNEPAPEVLQYNDRDFSNADHGQNFNEKLYEKIEDLKLSQPERFKTERKKSEEPVEVPVMVQRPRRKYVEISMEHDKAEEDMRQIILDAKKGLKKSQTKNLQAGQEEGEPLVENKVRTFDMDNLLNKNNIWLKDHGTLRKDHNKANAGSAVDFLKDSRSKLKPAGERRLNEFTGESIPPTANSQDEVIPFRKRIPKQTFVDPTDDFRSADRSTNSPSILGKTGGSLSNKSKKRLEDHAKRFEFHRKISNSSTTEVNAFLENVFKPVFAENDLTSSDSLMVSVSCLNELFFISNSFVSN